LLTTFASREAPLGKAATVISGQVTVRFAGRLLAALFAVVLVGCSSSQVTGGSSSRRSPTPGSPSSPTTSPVPTPSGSIRHLPFTRPGFQTDCQLVRTGTIEGAEYDLFGGVPGAIRRGRTPGRISPVKGSSCLLPALDRSVYASSVMLLNGQRVPAHAVFSYFLALPDVTDVAVFPDGFQMTATRVQFSCAHGPAPKKPAPYDCHSYTGLPQVDAWITWPTCWNGTGNGPSDVVYVQGTSCPAGFDRRLPKLQATFSWNVVDGTGATFSTGAFTARFTNGWIPQAMANLVRDCIRRPTPCGEVTNYFRRSPVPP
jgi:hypothetical protein